MPLWHEEDLKEFEVQAADLVGFVVCWYRLHALVGSSLEERARRCSLFA